ncbi:MAG: DUF167 domain-containing protein [Desulfovibrio sp.]|jgi:uncharacterized protein YggU (UPF0235/DUF167 family)|nr:DUF167 domain-containing protein [Desulfovibrio sp.]
MPAPDTPDTLPPFVSRAADGAWLLLVQALPGAKKSEFSGIRAGRLCIRVAAPAVENKANAALAELTARALGLRSAKISVLSGAKGRQKCLRIAADTEPDWNRLLP